MKINLTKRQAASIVIGLARNMFEMSSDSRTKLQQAAKRGTCSSELVKIIWVDAEIVKTQAEIALKIMDMQTPDNNTAAYKAAITEYLKWAEETIDDFTKAFEDAKRQEAQRN